MVWSRQVSLEVGSDQETLLYVGLCLCFDHTNALCTPESYSFCITNCIFAKTLDLAVQWRKFDLFCTAVSHIMSLVCSPLQRRSASLLQSQPIQSFSIRSPCSNVSERANQLKWKSLGCATLKLIMWLMLRRKSWRDPAITDFPLSDGRILPPSSTHSHRPL